MTVGNRQHRTRSLRGRVWRTADDIRVVAEFDVEEMERVGQSFMDLGWQALQSQSELGRSNWRLRQREASIVEASLTDALTGCGNRRQLEQWCEMEISRARRGAPLSAFMVDIDFFKRVNAELVHAAGDSVLVRFAALIREQIRATDLLARYGGEEFVLLMPGTPLSGALMIAERIRVALARNIIAPLQAPVTASFGVAELLDKEECVALLGRADRALYQAKHGGRNRVVAAAGDAVVAESSDGASGTISGTPA
jgi:two-component system cell cycle response regulator